MREHHPPQPSRLQELSFYLLLLAFFILLSNTSTVHTAKLKAVAESLKSTFAAAGRPTTMPEALGSLAGDSPGAATLFREIGDKVRTDIALAAVDVRSPGGPFEARFPIDELFHPGAADLRADRRALIAYLAERLRDIPAGGRFDVEAFIVGGWITPEMLGDGEPLAVARAGRLAAAFADAGLTGGRVAGGLMQRDDEYVRLLIHARQAGEADAPAAAPTVRP
jgi:hypothetical protein